MRYSFLFLSGLLLVAAGTARAQQTPPPPDSGAVEQYVLPVPPPNPLLTAADSARERARQENARRLRAAGNTDPAHPATMPSKQSTNVPLSGVVAAPESEKPSRHELARDAERRKEAARKAAEADRKREKTLYKRAKKSS